MDNNNDKPQHKRQNAKDYSSNNTMHTRNNAVAYDNYTLRRSVQLNFSDFIGDHDPTYKDASTQTNAGPSHVDIVRQQINDSHSPDPDVPHRQVAKTKGSGPSK